jgi:hypothetical protein
MRKTTFITTLVLAAAIVASSGVTKSQAGFPAPPIPGVNMPLPLPRVNVTVSGYLPAPPGVHIYAVDERPYYVRNDRRVYLERDHRHGRKYKKNKHRDNGYRDRGEGHGRDKHRD